MEFLEYKNLISHLSFTGMMEFLLLIKANENSKKILCLHLFFVLIPLLYYAAENITDPRGGYHFVLKQITL